MTSPPTLGFSLSSLAIRRSVATLVLTIAVVVFGSFAISKLQIDLLPDITYPRIGVELNAPGISPEVAVDEVTRPLEQALSATEGVEQVFSRTREGRVRVDLFFQPGENIDQALNDVTATYNRGRNLLPDVVEEPRIFKFDPSQLPIYEFALASETLTAKDLRIFADQELGRELTVVPGVALVAVSGGLAEEVQVNLDMNRMQALGITLDQVLTTLRKRNQDISGGRVEGVPGEPLTRTIGKFSHADELRNVSFKVNLPSNQAPNPLTQNLTRQVYLRDFAEVVDGVEQQRLFVNLNGKPAVQVSVQKQPDANTIAVVDAVKARLEELRQMGLITPDMILTTTLDESRFIKTSLETVIQAGAIGTALASLAVLLFLGSLRQTLIIISSIFFSSLTAVILMALFGLSLNIFSLGGLALGVGIVVDNSIVMMENIVVGLQRSTVGSSDHSVYSNGHGHEGHHSQINGHGNGNGHAGDYAELSSYAESHSPPPSTLTFSEVAQRAEESSRQVESALVASTATNLASVIPFLLLGGLISLLFNQLILTISFAVAASLLAAVTVVPALSAFLLGIPFKSGLDRSWFFRLFQERFAATQIIYGVALQRLLRYRLVILLTTFVVLGGGSWWLIGHIPQELLPRVNTGQANLLAQFPPGTTLAKNQQVMLLTDKILLAQPEVKYVFTSVGGSLFGRSLNSNPLRSGSNITLKPGTPVDRFIEKINREFGQLNLVGTRLRLTPGRVRGIILNNSPSVGSDLDVILQGRDRAALAQASRQVLAALDEKVKFANFRPDVDERQPELQVLPNWERLNALNLTTADIGQLLNTAVEGVVPTRLQRGERLVDVRVQVDSASIQVPSQLGQLPLLLANGQAVRLRDVATLQEGVTPAEIQRLNQREIFQVIGTLNRGASLSQALQQVTEVLKTIELPEGVSILPSSQARTSRQLNRAIVVLGSLAAFLVFVVMAVQYNSLIDPLVIMLTVPLAIAGGLMGLYVTGTAIGITVLIGVVLLVGIVVNNAIVMVELANQLVETGIDRHLAIVQASTQRLRPILMTTITTVLGTFPLAMGIGEGSEFLTPLGVVVFSGLSVSTLLTLFIIPCTYLLFHNIPWDWPLRPKRKRRSAKPSQEQAVEVA